MGSPGQLKVWLSQALLLRVQVSHDSRDSEDTFQLFRLTLSSPSTKSFEGLAQPTSSTCTALI